MRRPQTQREWLFRILGGRISFLIVTLLLGCFAFPAVAQTATLNGRVTDAQSDKGLANVNVVVQFAGQESLRFGTATLASGEFVVEGLSEGDYTLTVSHIGYTRKVISKIRLTSKEVRSLQILLSPTAIEREETLVYSTSRRAEKALEAPSAVSIIQGAEIQARPSLTPVEHLKGVPGVDFVTTGIMSNVVVVRGVNDHSSTRLLTLVDYRIARVPSLRRNTYSLIPTINEDIDRIEVVAGPGAALYGPNAVGGVMHVMTRSPFDFPGASVSIGAGERSLITGDFRQAGRLNPHAAYKISGHYSQATEWAFSDPAEPDSVVLGRQTSSGRVDEGSRVANDRDFDVRNIRLDGRLDFRNADDLTLTLSGGFSRVSNIGIGGGGAEQVEDWTYSYFKGGVSHGALFVQAFLNRNDSGNTYLLRNGDRLIDHSTQFVTQAQHGISVWGGRQRLTYGVDVLLTRPDTRFTVHGRNEDGDSVDEIGVYLQSETDLSGSVKFVAAGRVDDHSFVEGRVFSPRAALVFTPKEDHSVRLTYNRAFESPGTESIFSDRLFVPAGGHLGPYGVRFRGIPKTGLTFRRNSSGGVGGLYMQSPFTPASAGGASTSLPADATLMWGAIVGVLQAEGVDLSGIPPPGTDQVQSALRRLDFSSSTFEPLTPEELTDFEPYSSVIINTFEAGYKGNLRDKLFLNADLYYNVTEGAVRGALITPSVFLDAASLGAYLGEFMPAPNAMGLAENIAQIPVGTVTPQEALDPVELLGTAFNVSGKLSHYGADLGLAYTADSGWTFRATYSYMSQIDFPRTPDRSFRFFMNAPRHKGGASVTFHPADSGFDARLRLRYVDGFPMESGVYRGEIKAYAVLDLNAGCQLPFFHRARLVLSVQNLLDNRHQEFIGAPQIGRLGMVRLSYSR